MKERERERVGENKLLIWMSAGSRWRVVTLAQQTASFVSSMIHLVGRSAATQSSPSESFRKTHHRIDQLWRYTHFFPSPLSFPRRYRFLEETTMVYEGCVSIYLQRRSSLVCACVCVCVLVADSCPFRHTFLVLFHEDPPEAQRDTVAVINCFVMMTS